jgi:cytochrome o ubiquinol oxidase subunit 2
MKKNCTNYLMNAGFLMTSVLLSGCSKLVVLNSSGSIGKEESLLIKIAFGLMLIVVIPVFILVPWISKKYRASNMTAPYQPKWTNSASIEWIIWLVPISIVVVLSYIAWNKTHELDPYKPLESNVTSVRIEVVSTDWNWLFIYPDYNIAIVNQLVFPVNVPLSFRLTSGSVMTSFFIPQLGSQMYAMAGMQTQLNLIANDTGTFRGQNMEFSGKGYNEMHFEATAISQDQFRVWVKEAKKSPYKMDLTRYEEFSKPNIAYPVTSFSAVKPDLFNHIMNEFMGGISASRSNMKKMVK